jgi:arylformamidase
MFMKIYDVTVAIGPDTPIYAGDPPASVESAKRLAGGDSANVSKLAFGAHTGTHVDAPNHFIDGMRRVDRLDLNKLIGPCRVIRIADDVKTIEPEHFDNIEGIERVIFKTQNSAFWNETEFHSDFTHLSPAAADALVESGIKLVGIDYLSIERFKSGDHAVHKAFLSKEIVILEGLDLREVEPGDYELICLPLKYEGGEGDGSPARTVLISR